MVADAVIAKGRDSIWYQGQAGVAAAFDVVVLDFHVAGGVSEGDAGRVLAGDDAVVDFAVLRFDTVGVIVRLDFAVGIKNVNDEFSGAVRAHAGEIRRDVLPLALKPA